ncbi:MAG: IMPACT family protein [candidate division KSB1 bacterium]|nr:IMPACT family protein [candidate division KSB1 bacterium]MDZ7303257.1 IMPACT family protein [candidate division KSB1 bacterium]MDZ7312561.1 IMPACT family protein [candidate division KSB1 bacterium]
MNEYYSITAPVEAEIKVKDSRFIAFLRPIETREQAEACLVERVRQYRDATHHCYAFRIGFDDRLIAKASDAGEPAGTAGRPILQALERRNLTNVLAVVTRYFGGTKLGPGGLSRAYGSTTAAAIDLATLVAVYPKQTVSLRFAYPQHSAVQKILRRVEATSIRESFGVEIEQLIEIRAHRSEEAQQLLRDACAGKISIEVITKK